MDFESAVFHPVYFNDYIDVRASRRRGVAPLPGGAERRPPAPPSDLRADNHSVPSKRQLAAEPGTELSVGIPDELPRRSAKPGSGLSPWQLARRRLRRDRIALVGGIVFLLLVPACIAAPLWAKHVAHTTPDEEPPLGHDRDRTARW